MSVSNGNYPNSKLGETIMSKPKLNSFRKRKISKYEKSKRKQYQGKPLTVSIGSLCLDSLLRQQLARS